MLKKLIAIFFIVCGVSFSCEYENMHKIGQALINKGYVKIEGNKFIVDVPKLENFIKDMDENSIVLITLTVTEYPKQHNLELVMKK